MPLWKNKALNLTEREIRYAMENTKSNVQAAAFLGCHITTYRRYAEQYIDSASGKSLYELHKNIGGRGISRQGSGLRGFGKTDIFEILEGKHPSYNPERLLKRILEEGVIPEQCSTCGFDERRITDFRVPLVLVWDDGDTTNHKLENLNFLCYNCFFLTYDDVFNKVSKVSFKCRV